MEDIEDIDYLLQAFQEMSSTESEETEESTTLEEAAQANTNSILRPFQRFNTASDYLESDDVQVDLHSAHIADGSVLGFKTDLDGVLVELTKFSHIRPCVHQLHLPDGPHRVRNHWSWIKKHINVKDMPRAVKTLWTRVHGVDLGTVDGGYHLNLTLVPSDNTTKFRELEEAGKAREATQIVVANVMRTFVENLDRLTPSDMARATIQANNLRGSEKNGKISVKAGDTAFILGLIDRAIDETALPSGSKVMRSLILMGDKQSGALNVAEIAPLEEILSLSVHAAVSIHGEDPNMHLMWSRCGIQNVTHRGQTWTSMSMHEGANYQSELCPDIKEELSRVLADGFRQTPVNFYQLYCDSPHNKQVGVFFSVIN